jgi:pimeloyl-ACP methyl ester carboxylesterase
MKKRAIFPLFNGVVSASFGGLIGYYIFRPISGTLWGGVFGLSLGLIIEFLLGRLGLTHWLYRRRVVLLVLLEMPIAIFVVGPYAFVLAELRPFQHSVCCETPLDYGAVTYEDVQIQTSEGISLAGWYVPPLETPGAVIVLLHGSHGDRIGTAWHAQQLIQAGYGVLLYDQRALGESTGKTLSFGWLDGPDLLAVFDYLADRPEVDSERIGVVGLSLGAQIALNAAYQAPDRVSVLWLDGVQAQRIEDFPEAKNVGEQFATVMNVLILKAAEIYLERPAPPAFVEILVELDQPEILLVFSGKDDFENRISQKYAEVIGANAQMWLIQDAAHTGGPTAVPDEYSQRMLAFFAMAFAK